MARGSGSGLHAAMINQMIQQHKQQQHHHNIKTASQNSNNDSISHQSMKNIPMNYSHTMQPTMKNNVPQVNQTTAKNMPTLMIPHTPLNEKRSVLSVHQQHQSVVSQSNNKVQNRKTSEVLKMNSVVKQQVKASMNPSESLPHVPNPLSSLSVMNPLKPKLYDQEMHLKNMSNKAVNLSGYCPPQSTLTGIDANKLISNQRNTKPNLTTSNIGKLSIPPAAKTNLPMQKFRPSNMPSLHHHAATMNLQSNLPISSGHFHFLNESGQKSVVAQSPSSLHRKQNIGSDVYKNVNILTRRCSNERAGLFTDWKRIQSCLIFQDTKLKF